MQVLETLAIFKTTDQCWPGCGGEGTLAHVVDGSVDYHSHYGMARKILRKLKLDCHVVHFWVYSQQK
jgi:hypothetical protein